MYCDIFNEACHDDMDIKMATGNDAYDWQPEISCERKLVIEVLAQSPIRQKIGYLRSLDFE